MKYLQESKLKRCCKECSFSSNRSTKEFYCWFRNILYDKEDGELYWWIPEKYILDQCYEYKSKR